MKNCAKCNGDVPGDLVYSVTRSTEWGFDKIWARELDHAAVTKRRVILCDSCKRNLEAIVYNWFNDLPLSHNPF